MSASSKKKLRNEQQTAKMTEKQVAEQKEAKKLTLYTTIFVVVLAVMVVFAIAIGVTRSISNSGVRERNTVALTVGDHEISNAELSYFYMSAINNFNSNYGSYAAMMGLDTSKPLDQQTVSSDGDLTWADDFLNTAKDNARSIYAMADAAEAAGFTLSEDDLADIDSSISNLQLYASLYGYSSTKDFLKAATDPISGYRIQASGKTVQHCGRSICSIIGITDLKIHSCTCCHTHFCCMTSGIVNVPCISG